MELLLNPKDPRRRTRSRSTSDYMRSASPEDHLAEGLDLEALGGDDVPEQVLRQARGVTDFPHVPRAGLWSKS